MIAAAISLGSVSGIDIWDKDNFTFSMTDYSILNGSFNAYALDILGSPIWHVGSNATSLVVSNLEFPTEIGLIFNNVSAVKYCEVWRAYLTLTFMNSWVTGPIDSVTIYGIDDSDPQHYTTLADFLGRHKTTAFKVDVIDEVHIIDDIHVTVDVSTIIQEIFDEGQNWGDNVELRITNGLSDSSRFFYGYDEAPLKSAVLSICHDGDGSPVLFSTMANKGSGYWLHFYEGWEGGTPIYNSPPTNGWYFKDYGASYWSEVQGSALGIKYVSRPYFTLGYQTVLGSYQSWVWNDLNLTSCDAAIAGFKQAYNIAGKGSGARFIIDIPIYGKVHFYNAHDVEDIWYGVGGYLALPAIPYDGGGPVCRLSFSIGQGGSHKTVAIDNNHFWLHFPSRPNVTDLLGDDYPEEDLDLFFGNLSVPQYSNVGANNTIRDYPTLFYCDWQDLIEMDTCIFSTNVSGSWVNHTIGGFGGFADTGYFEDTMTNDDFYFYEWFCNNSLGLWNFTGIQALETAATGLIDADIDSFGEWLFMGEVYTLDATFNFASYAEINFTNINNVIQFTYDNDTKIMNLETEGEFIAGLILAQRSVNYSTQEFNFTWKFILNKNILDELNVTFNHYCEDDINVLITGGATNITRNIYNLGGFVSYEFEGDAGRRIGGDALEIHHTNSTGTGAYVDVIYRRLQHVHLAFALDVEDNDCFDVDELSGVVEFGLKYYNESAWHTILFSELFIVNGAVDPAGAGAGKAFIIPYISWNSRQDTGYVSTVRSDTLSGYPECGDDVNAPVTNSKFYLDLWFNSMNYSTTIGGRISTKYYGMDETGWLFWNSWRPVMVNETESMFFDDLRDWNGSILQVSDIELVKFYIRVLKIGAGSGSCDTHTWMITEPEFSKTLAGDRMQAINTPEGIDTLVIDMPSTGFMQPITKAIQGIGIAIWMSALGFIKILFGAMDSFFYFIGFPAGTFTLIVDYVLTIPDFMISLIGHLANLIGNMGTQVTRLFALIAVGLPQFLYGTGILVTTFIEYVNQIRSLFTGGWTGISNFWTSLELAQWVELFVIAVLPFMWLDRVFSSKDSFKTAREDIGWMFKMIFALVDLGSWLIRMIGSMIQAIRNILPI